MNTKERLFVVEMPAKDIYLITAGNEKDDTICVKITHENEPTVVEDDYITFYTDNIDSMVDAIQNFLDSKDMYLLKESIYKEIIYAQNDLINKFNDTIAEQKEEYDDIYDKMSKLNKDLQSIRDILLGSDNLKQESEPVKKEHKARKNAMVHKDDTAKTDRQINSGKLKNGKHIQHKYETPKIIKEHGDVMLEMWKTMTGKQIHERFPMYTISQIIGYCRRNSDFIKRGVSKEIIEKLKSYNGTKTLKELREIYPNSNLKRLCKNHDIKYKEEK